MKKIFSYLFALAVLLPNVSGFLLAGSVSAQTIQDSCQAYSDQTTEGGLSYEDCVSIYSETPFYSDTEPVDQVCSVESDMGPISVPPEFEGILDEGSLQKIAGFRPLYEEAARNAGIPWQMLPAIHYLETSLGTENRLSGEGYHEGIFQFHSMTVAYVTQQTGRQPSSHTAADKALSAQLFPPGPVTDNNEIVRQLEIAADILIEKASSGLDGGPYDLISDPSVEAVKSAFFGYNGRASFYRTQAESLGFDRNLEGYQGSAYVMNRFPDSVGVFNNMQIAGGLGTATRPGTFTIFAMLAGLTSSCDSPTGGSIVDIARAELAKNISESSGLNCGPGIGKYWSGSTNEEELGRPDGSGGYACNSTWAWCAAFVSWVYKSAGVTIDESGWLHPGVVNLQGVMTANGDYFVVGEDTPQPGDIAFYIGAQTPDEGSESHVNIVVSVSGNTMTTIGGNQSNSVSQGSQNIELGLNGLVGFGRVGYTK